MAEGNGADADDDADELPPAACYLCIQDRKRITALFNVAISLRHCTASIERVCEMIKASPHRLGDPDWHRMAEDTDEAAGRLVEFGTIARAPTVKP